MTSRNGVSNSEMRSFVYGSALYVTLAAIGVVAILFTEAAISLQYVFTGAFAGSLVISGRYVLDEHSLLQRLFDFVIVILLYIFVLQEVTGTLAMFVGAFLSMVITSYLMHFYRK